MPIELDYVGLCDDVVAAMHVDGVELTPQMAWSFLYRFVLQVTPTDDIHIAESNVLKTKAWKERSDRVEKWLCANLVPGQSLTMPELKGRLGRLFAKARELGAKESAIPNYTGKGFEVALSYLIKKLCGVEPLAGQSITKFRGFQLAPRGEVDEPDLALFSFDDFRIVISLLWTTRKDRLGADLYDAVFFRRRRPDLAILIVANEYQLNLLDALLKSPDVDAVYHISPDALLEAHNPLPPNAQFTTQQLLGNKKPIPEYGEYLSIRSRLKPLSQLFADIDASKPTE